MDLAMLADPAILFELTFQGAVQGIDLRPDRRRPVLDLRNSAHRLDFSPGRVLHGRILCDVLHLRGPRPAFRRWILAAALFVFVLGAAIERGLIEDPAGPFRARVAAQFLRADDRRDGSAAKSRADHLWRRPAQHAPADRRQPVARAHRDRLRTPGDPDLRRDRGRAAMGVHPVHAHRQGDPGHGSDSEAAQTLGKSTSMGSTRSPSGSERH